MADETLIDSQIEDAGMDAGQETAEHEEPTATSYTFGTIYDRYAEFGHFEIKKWADLTNKQQRLFERAYHAGYSGNYEY